MQIGIWYLKVAVALFAVNAGGVLVFVIFIYSSFVFVLFLFCLVCFFSVCGFFFVENRELHNFVLMCNFPNLVFSITSINTNVRKFARAYF